MGNAYQNVVEEVKNLKGIEEAVALAIEREKEARDFYLSKAALMDNSKFKELYEHLANEEVKHIGYLERYRNERELPVISTEIPSGQSFTPEFDIGRIKGGEITLGDAGILVAALRHERKSEDFYSEVAKRAEDERLKKFF
jgi:erythrin-vacuolar iron transport family protein